MATSRRTVDAIDATRSGSGALSPDDSYPQSTWVEWTHTDYTNQSLMDYVRAYFSIPASGVQERKASNYNETRYGYDSMQRLTTTTSPGGTIYPKHARCAWTRHRGLGRHGRLRHLVRTTWCRSPPTRMTEREGLPCGDGLLTQNTTYHGSIPGNPFSHLLLVTNYFYDWRKSCGIGVADASRTYTATAYDNRALPRQSAKVHRKPRPHAAFSSREKLRDSLGRTYHGIHLRRSFGSGRQHGVLKHVV